MRLVFAEKTTVLGFDSNDSIHSNQITRRMATWLSQKDGPLTFILSPMGRGESHDAMRRAKTRERRSPAVSRASQGAIAFVTFRRGAPTESRADA